MKRMIKKLYRRYLVDAMSAMALGLFASLIVGLILDQLGRLPFLSLLRSFAEIVSPSSPVVGAAIGVAVATGLKAPKLAAFTSAVSGALGYQLSGVPGAYLASVAGAEAGRALSGKTALDILLVPAAVILAGGFTAQLLSTPLNAGIAKLQAFLAEATLLQPVPMGIVLSVVFGLALTAPISSAALAAVVFAPGVGQELHEGLALAAGAATVGCCCQMVGFAVASFRENGVSGLVAQGLGTSMLQFGNILARPLIWLPPTLASALLGPLSTVVFRMKNASAAAGMGTSGLVGQVGTFIAMADGGAVRAILSILALHLVLPAGLTLVLSEGMRRAGLIRYGDMRLPSLREGAAPQAGKPVAGEERNA